MIRILDKETVAKIAAGEVVERPLSVVKELVENSVDAGADAIVVEIRNGGKSYIRVSDNGCGIDAGEVLLAFKSHATSKIATEEDLQSIETLGFRGEALASIAAVSKVELVTKTRESKVGKKVEIAGGEVILEADTGCPDGTTIVVADLFYNTPARRKFLKADNTEATQIIDFVSRMALAYTNIKFRLINNGAVLFNTRGNGDLYTAILTVYDKRLADALVEIDYADEGGGLALSGFVSRINITRTNRKDQIFFVNGRSVQSKVVEKGVDSAYSDRLFEGRYPLAFLFLHVDPTTLDVNIHPNKREVRFSDEVEISTFVADGIRAGIKASEAMPGIAAVEKTLGIKSGASVSGVKKEAPATEKKFEPTEAVENEIDKKILLSTLREEQALEQKKSEQLNLGQVSLTDSPQTAFTYEPKGEKTAKAFNFSALRVLGAVFATYILACDEDSFYLIDQHAAHERVFFEKLMREYAEADKPAQELLLPMLVNTSYAFKNGTEPLLSVLKDMGFDIEDFGPKTFRVTAVPAFMDLSEAEDFLNYFVENAGEGENLRNQRKIEDIMQASCKAAVKGNDRLNPEEIRALLLALDACENPYSCPHGRPTFVKLTKHEIERLFKRV